VPVLKLYQGISKGEEGPIPCCGFVWKEVFDYRGVLWVRQRYVQASFAVKC